MGGGDRAVVCLLLLLAVNQSLFCVKAGKILVWPVEFSHWLNIKTIIDELIARGHNVTVFTHSASPTVQPDPSQTFSVDMIQVPYTKKDLTDALEKLMDYWIYKTQENNLIQNVLQLARIIGELTEQSKILCQQIFVNQDLLEKWKRDKFDAILIDPMNMCGDIIAKKLNLPMIVSLRFSFGNSMERLCGQLPSPASYVPGVTLQYTDHMDFPQRVFNLLNNLLQDFIFKFVLFTTWDPVYTEIMGEPASFCEMMGRADVWLIRTYWDFEYPRTFLPNFQFVGGLHCKPAKPLPDEIEKFVQSSGDDGVVVFSLGSMIKNLTKERANTIAEALGQIPQKVLWRYMGEKPETLAPNTRLYKWIPQNDLLGHPKTKAFVSHGGTNGIYEAIHHGVPIVGLPMFADQPDNIMHMKTKGAAVMLDYNKMTTKDLKEAIDDVINNPSYKESMMTLSRIHHDQPMTPLDRAVFWIEFVMRNKGAKHLRVASHDLTWYQYHCLDVAVFLLSVIGLIIFLFVKTCKWLLRKCLKRSSKKSKKE